jgi:hypothetical protein
VASPYGIVQHHQIVRGQVWEEFVMVPSDINFR